ncbi:MAG: hypothetical protein CMO74_00555 [Verrucomicrobiales bacterium]|nr:hypothetical protein [Verrucomicrobiales bacterium]|tara:strand:- start:8573 stop:11401 length:2829 start_codon:yes stop_codon:yes gene_type:complete
MRSALAIVLLLNSQLASGFTKDQLAWWSYQPVRKPAVPRNAKNWAINEIDHFVARKFTEQKLAPAKPASKRTLIRRVTLDLTGLPPTPEKIAAFLEDPSPNAYVKLVDRLLASPRYGEHQASIWLDLVRYADSDGYRADHYRPEAWRYRDYVIRSFNADKPYDRFVREQLAGDEVDPGNRDALIGTMFLRHWIYEHNQRDVETQWEEILADVTNVTADVFLGLGMQCARCHDHKFDPILQKDYYRMQAFFAPMLPRASMPVGTAAERTQHFAAEQKWRRETDALRRRLHDIERPVLLKHATREGFDKFIDKIKAMIRKRPEDRTAYEKQIAEMAERQFDLEPAKLPERLKGATRTEWEKLRKALRQFESQRPKPLPKVKFVISDAGPVAPVTRIPKKGTVVEPGFLTLLDPSTATITPPPAGLQSSGRRTALANWITRADNPFTARVMVNRMWQQHFGHGLAANTSDFGKLGTPPTHPQLLDWLAARLVAENWSLKKLHRLMVTSATYRQAANNPAAVQADPANTWFARATVQRMSAEQVRDSLLAMAGQLDLKEGGASVDATKSNRRSVYRKVMRNKPDEVMHAFDTPDHISHMPQRTVTTTAMQSLLMMNSDWTRQRAAGFARRLAKLHPNDATAQIRAAHEFTTGHTATQSQQALGLAFLSPYNAPLVTQPPAAPKTGELKTLKPTAAAALSPSGPQRSLEVNLPGPLPSGDFTAEAFIQLHSLFPDASVRTIVSQWNSSKATPGWSLGVTSTKSAYKPRNLILQLIGVPQRGDHGYEVIASNLRPELNKPYYVAVSLKFNDSGAGTANFFLRDLSRPDAPMQTATKPFAKNKHYATLQAPIIGGRAQTQNHSWDGLIGNVRLTNRPLSRDETLLLQPAAGKDTLAHWKFTKDNFYADSSANKNTLRSVGTSAPMNPRLTLLTEYCHVLLNANAFLYID